MGREASGNLQRRVLNAVIAVELRHDPGSERRRRSLICDRACHSDDDYPLFQAALMANAVDLSCVLRKAD